MKKLMIMAVAAMASGLAAMAVTTTSFAYQGVLRDELGQPLGKEQATITFRLYDVATEGSAVWTKEMNLAIDTNGLFNAELTGSDLAEAIADAENTGKTLYVGLTVSGSAGEITPRQKMIPTPLASYAQNVAKAQGDFTVMGTAYFEGAVSMKNESPINAAGVNVSSTLDVTGAAVLNGGAELRGEVKVADSLTVRGVQMSMPIGSIIMWSGAADELPADGCWALCDGQTTYAFNGNTNDVRTVPDLRGRFIVGVGTSTDPEGNTATYSVGDADGLNKHKLSVDEMPSHTHTLGGEGLQVDNKDDYIMKCLGWEKGDDPHDPQGTKKTYTYTTSATGNGAAHENRPPYYALCYIIKIK